MENLCLVILFFKTPVLLLNKNRYYKLRQKKIRNDEAQNSVGF